MFPDLSVRLLYSISEKHSKLCKLYSSLGQKIGRQNIILSKYWSNQNHLIEYLEGLIDNDRIWMLIN